MNHEVTFNNLVSQVENVHNATSSYAKGAVNQLLTIRNWLIGYYIVTYEQRGRDRAQYGANILSKLAKTLNIKGLDRSQLNLCRIFYIKYPQICATVSHKLKAIKNIENIPEIIMQDNDDNVAGQEICETPSHKFVTPPEVLISNRRYLTKRPLRISERFELFDTWVHTFMSLYQTYPERKEHPNVAIVDFLENATMGDFEEFKGVYAAGHEYSQDAWSILAAALYGKGHICQTYCAQYLTDNIDFAWGDGEWHPYINMQGLYVYNGEFTGVLMRMACGENIIVAHENERTVPVFTVKQKL